MWCGRSRTDADIAATMHTAPARVGGREENEILLLLEQGADVDARGGQGSAQLLRAESAD